MIKKADRALAIFPLSLTALMAKWITYDSLNEESKSNIYYSKAAILFDAMNKTGGFSRNAIDNPIIGLSENDIKQYADTYAGGARFEFKKKIEFKNGSILIVYTSILGNRYFIICL